MQMKKVLLKIKEIAKKEVVLTVATRTNYNNVFLYSNR